MRDQHAPPSTISGWSGWPGGQHEAQEHAAVSPMRSTPVEVVKQKPTIAAQRRAEQDHQRMAALQGSDVVVTAQGHAPAGRPGRRSGSSR